METDGAVHVAWILNESRARSVGGLISPGVAEWVVTLIVPLIVHPALVQTRTEYGYKVTGLRFASVNTSADVVCILVLLR